MADGRGAAFDLLELGSRRFDVLSRLDEAPASKPELADGLDVSRSTVNRALRELEERNLVDRTGGAHVLTPAGRVLVGALDGYLDELAALAEVSEMLARLPTDVTVPREFLRGAEVIRATPPSPARALRRVGRSLQQADGSRCLVGEFASERAAEFFRDQVASDLDLEVVFDDHVLSFLLAERREELGVYVEEGSVYSVDDIPFSLLITDADGDATAHFVVYDDDGDLAGLLVNDDPAAVEWAVSTFERYRAEATALDA